MLSISKTQLNNFLPFFLISFGLVLIGFVFGIRVSQRILSFNEKPKAVVQVQAKNIPARINIPKIKISLPVDVSSIKGGVWEISPRNASFLDISEGLGQGGNTVIYGHNKNSIFGPIRWLKKGDEIEVVDKSGKAFKYEVVETVTVGPDAIEYVEPKDNEILTLYTCTGLFDSKRYIVIAHPKIT